MYYIYCEKQKYEAQTCDKNEIKILSLYYDCIIISVFTWVVCVRLAGGEGRDGRCSWGDGNRRLLGRSQMERLRIRRRRRSLPQRFLICGWRVHQRGLRHFSLLNRFRLRCDAGLSAKSNRRRNLLLIDWFSFPDRCQHGLQCLGFRRKHIVSIGCQHYREQIYKLT